MSEAQATISERRRISMIWLVPLVALALGVWMVIYTLRSEGPEVTIVFASADGIETGKTKVKVLNVEVGIVESAGLSDDHQSVVVKARLEKAATGLLRQDTQFWVVRPRVGTAGVSGLGTLLSGGYIQLQPGTGEEGRRKFVALDDPPVTPVGTPGLNLVMIGAEAGSVQSGDPILYKGFRVGRVETSTFDIAEHHMHYEAFIEAPYDELVTESTRFWNASGISLSATADGIEVDIASLETLLIGGVVMGLPEHVEPGQRVADGATFELYRNQASVNERPYEHSLEYVVRVSQSVRGLRPGAPVEYRGVHAGRVERLLLQELAATGADDPGVPIPVLIRVEPGRLMLPDSEEGVSRLQSAVKAGVERGLRATLSSGNMLTGSLYVALDYYSNEPPAEMGTFAGRPTIPTIASGLSGLEHKLSSVLDKVNALPLTDTLARVEDALVSLNTILASEHTRSIPESLNATLAELTDVLGSVSADSALQQRLLSTVGELDRTLERLGTLLDTISEQPNALIFNRELPEDPQPPAGPQ